MVEFDLTLPAKQNVVWLPKVLVNCLGRKVKITTHSIAALMYSANADVDDVLTSLKIIAADLEAKKNQQTPAATHRRL
jgi:hypothetical protein